MYYSIRLENLALSYFNNFYLIKAETKEEALDIFNTKFFDTYNVNCSMQYTIDDKPIIYKNHLSSNNCNFEKEKELIYQYINKTQFDKAKKIEYIPYIVNNTEINLNILKYYYDIALNEVVYTPLSLSDIDFDRVELFFSKLTEKQIDWLLYRLSLGISNINMSDDAKHFNVCSNRIQQYRGKIFRLMRNTRFLSVVYCVGDFWFKIDTQVNNKIVIYDNSSFIRGSFEYKIGHCFKSMIYRCYNKDSQNYEHYGAKGIFICKFWLNNYINFKKWYIDNAKNIDNSSIDRIDPRFEYAPYNCQIISRNRNSQKARLDENRTKLQLKLDERAFNRRKKNWLKEMKAKGYSEEELI